jgi:predicted NBD/HSP70 family sugar kinase
MSDAALSVGVDIGGTTTRTVFYDAAGRAVHTAVSSTPRGPAALLDHIADEIDRGRDGHLLSHIGIGVPGAVLDGTVTMALNVGIESPLAIGPELTRRLGAPVNVENDVNAAALGAHLYLDRNDEGGSLAYVSIGTGVAAGLVIDGRIVRGAGGVAGEIGHIPMTGNARRCVCGQTGCIETVASGSALRTRMHEAGVIGDAAALWSAADEGDERARSIRDDAVVALAWGCYVTMLLVDVERVVIGGGVGVALGERMVAPLRERLRTFGEHSPFVRSLRLPDRLVAAPPDVELGALGAERSAGHRPGAQR